MSLKIEACFFIPSVIMYFLYNQLFRKTRGGGGGAWHESGTKLLGLNEVDFKIRIRTEMLSALFKCCDKGLNLKDFENESDMT